MKQELENMIIFLLNHQSGKRNAMFYAHFIAQMKREINTKIPAPMGIGIRKGKPVLVINPDYISKLDWTLEQKAGVLVHECEHLIREHCGSRRGSDKETRIYNIAQDWAINQYIPELRGIGCIEHEDMVKMEEFKDCEREMNFEYYLDYLRKAKSKWDKEGNDKEQELSDKILDDHSQMDGELESSEKAELKEWLKRTMKDSIRKAGGVGNTPNHINQLYNDLVSASVPWKQQLRKFVARAISLNKQATRKRTNRRYGLYQPGKKKNAHLRLAICIDESGSIGENEFMQFFGEVDKISDYAEIQVLQCDTQVNKVYEYKKKQSFERTGSGGTLYNPMIEAASELEVDGIIILGDMDCFEDLIIKPKIPVMWATIRGNKPPVDWGFKCEITVKEEK